MTETLKKEIVITVGGKSFTIPFPKIRQQFDIESRKHLFAKNTYGIQEASGTNDSAFNLNLVDAIAHFAVLLPDLPSKFDMDGYYELDMGDQITIDILKAYKKDFYPWYQKIKEEINKQVNESDASTSKDEN